VRRSSQSREEVEKPFLKPLVERLGVPHHQHVESSEEQRRSEVGEHRGEPLRVLIRPQDPPGACSIGRDEPLAEHPHCALHEERLLPVEQVERTERIVGKGGEWIPCRRQLQKPSIAFEYTSCAS
jgi:hypothetical protein